MRRPPGNRFLAPAIVGAALGGLVIVVGPRFVGALSDNPPTAATLAKVGDTAPAAAPVPVPADPPAMDTAASVPVPPAPAPPGGSAGDLLVVGSTVAAAKQVRSRPHYTILQIGDSHTAADFFSGRVRDLLQQRFGPGGVYLPPGTPHAGIRSSAFAIKVSPGWDYQSMAKSDEDDRFWLTGYTADAATAEAEISFTAPKPVAFDAIDVSFLRQPGAGAVDILLDGTVVDQVALDGPAGEPLIHRLMPFRTSLDHVREIAIRTASAAPVSFSGVFIEQRLSGVSYLSVGFPGAKVSILKRMAPKNLSDDITRVSPDMVVLAFGTNEGFDDKLDLGEYRQTLTDIIHAIQAARPKTTIVIVGPPPGARQASDCATAVSSCPGDKPVEKPTTEKAGAACWSQPPNLDQVRTIQQAVATDTGAVFWDWSKVLPSACDIEQGRLGSPALFGPDRVHLTLEGYRRTADAFATFLTPLVRKGMAQR